jgi:hypothetical protein
MNWQHLSMVSPYQTAVAIHEELMKGNVAEADHGILELIETLSRSEKRALKSQLIRLMKHIIKWESQPARRSRSWIASIHGARNEIRDIQEETPSLNDKVIHELWEICIATALIEAEAEMNQDSAIERLTWEQVFQRDYSLKS